VSWKSAVSGDAVTLRASPLESRRFGLSFSRAEVPLAVEDPDVALSSVLRFLEDDESDVVVVRHPAARVGWFAALREAGRDLIAADTLTYWRLAVGDGRRPAPRESVSTRVTDSPEASLVKELVNDMFAGYGNHYLANPLLDPVAALAGYVEWGQRSAAEDQAVIVSHADRGAVGLATMQTSDRVSEIQLAGIRQQFHKQGIYPHLLAGCEDAVLESGGDLLVISTQAHNTNVQRSWARYGFEPVGAVSTVHAVRRGLLP
jgi:ribosomal protein S18 acetylase RimI-like enzyme